MLQTLLIALYFILPAYVANMFPVILGALKFPFGQPISEKWLGSHKTWRGFYAGYLGALLVLLFQQYVASETAVFVMSPVDVSSVTPVNNGFNFNTSALLDYAQINIFLYAIPFGLGAIAGDAIKSFFKRRLNRKPGAPFFPFDQLDFVIGALLSLLPFYILDPESFLASPFQPAILLMLLVLTPLLHLLTNLLAYALGMKKVWW